MAWYWEYGNELQRAVHLVTCDHQLTDTMELDVHVSVGRCRPPSSQFMRFICTTESGASDMQFDLSPSSKRSIHHLFCLDTSPAVDSMPEDSKDPQCASIYPPACLGSNESDPEILCEPPAGAEEISNDDCLDFTPEDYANCCTPKRQRLLPL